MDRNISILVVGNYQSTVPVVKDLLNQLGLSNIDKECDGAVALKKLNETPYELVISEWNIESMSGMDFLKEVRATGNNVRFMMVAEQCGVQDVLAAKEAGVDNFILKPLNAGTFRDKLQQMLGIQAFKTFRAM